MNTLTSQTPLVSILIPVYNRDLFIGKAIDSGLCQTYKNIEIIVIDNNSTDTTWKIILEYQEKDERVRAYKNEINIGPTNNWLSCAKKAKGKYACFLFSDDLFEEDYVKKMLKCIINNYEIGFVFSSAKLLLKDSSRKIVYNKLETGKYETTSYINDVFLTNEYFFSPGHAILRTEDIKTNIIINIENKLGIDLNQRGIGSDLLIFLMTALQYKYYYVLNEPLAVFRIHSGSITINEDPKKLMVYYFLAKSFFLEKYFPDPKLTRKFNAVIAFELLKSNKNLTSIKISDFYNNIANSKLSIFYFIIHFLRRLLKRLLKNSVSEMVGS